MKKVAVFDVPGDPKGKERPRRGRNGFYTPKATHDYEARVAHSFLDACGRQSLEGYVEVWIEAYFRVPVSWSKKRKRSALDGEILPKGRPDIDNIAKAILDGLNRAHAWQDDSWVTDLHCRKMYGENPHVHVTLEQVVPSNV